MKFRSLQLEDWRQFKAVEIQLHPNLTILTGPNGSGKSTILSLLERCLLTHDPIPFLATPVNDAKTGESGFSIGTLFKRYNPFRRRSNSESPESNEHEIGSIKYSTDFTSKITVQRRDTLQYDVNIYDRKEVNGFKISSHRASPRYQQVQTLPVSGIRPREAFEYFSQSQRHYQRGDRYHRAGVSVTNPVAPMKETLIGFAAFGADNAHLKAVPELVGLFDSFQNLLRNLLPSEIGFEALEVRSPEIVIISRTGEFPLDSASGGLMSLLQTAWEIFLFTKAYGDEAVVIIDEPENHLHPSLQRDFLGNLTRGFPDVQFIVATHSPFVITSVKESKIYALRYSEIPDSSDGMKAVVSQEIDLNSKAKPAEKILNEVLGVPVTIPPWAERDLKEIVNRFESNPIDEHAISSLRSDLNAANLLDFFPEALGMMARDKTN